MKNDILQNMDKEITWDDLYNRIETKAMIQKKI